MFEPNLCFLIGSRAISATICPGGIITNSCSCSSSVTARVRALTPFCPTAPFTRNGHYNQSMIQYKYIYTCRLLRSFLMIFADAHVLILSVKGSV